MTITLVKLGKKGAIKKVEKFEYEDVIAKYKITTGQVYLSADGAAHGVVVVGVGPINVSVTPISPAGVSGPDQTMDAKQMSQVDFYLVEPPYITWTKSVMKKYWDEVKEKSLKTKKGKKS